MPQPTLKARYTYMTASRVRKILGLSRYQLDERIRQGIFPEPTAVDSNGIRLFDENWLRVAQAILANSFEGRKRKQANE